MGLFVLSTSNFLDAGISAMQKCWPWSLSIPVEGLGVGNTVWLSLQSYNAKLLAMALSILVGVGLGITVISGPKMFSQPKQLSQC